MTGKPVDIASRMVLEMPSPKEGKHKKIHRPHQLRNVRAFTGKPSEAFRSGFTQHVDTFCAGASFADYQEPQPLTS